MKFTKQPCKTVVAALLIAGTLATPAAAASNRFISDCDSWKCELLQYIFNRGCSNSKPDVPVVPEVPEETPEVPDVPVVPDTPEETPEEPDAPETDNGTVSSLERRVVDLVNAERAAYGLAPLTLRTDLSDGARLKSQDMRDNRYFDHNSPTYGTPFEMMQSLGITYSAAAENIAMGYSTAEAVVTGWMNSAGHRATILSDKYTYIGVGHVDGYWTQWFTR